MTVAGIDRQTAAPIVVLALVVATAFGVGLSAASGNAPTIDEPWHLAYGGRVLASGSAAKVAWYEDGMMAWSALPAAVAGIGPEGPQDFGQVVTARTTTVACLALLSILLFVGAAHLTGSRWLGVVAAALPLASPNLLAHGALATLDVPPAPGWLLAVLGALAWRRRPGWLPLTLLAVGLSWAVVAKFTSLLLVAGLLVLLPLSAWLPEQDADAGSRGRAALRSLGAVALAGLVAAVALQLADPGGFSLGTAAGSVQEANRIIGLDAPGPPPPQTLEQPALGALPLPFPADYAAGLQLVRAHEARGHWSYLLGEHRMTGWPHYHLALLAIKVPVAAWLAALVGLAAWLRRRRFDATDLLLLGPVALVLLAGATSSLQLGLRHVLVVVPLLQLWLVRCWAPLLLGSWRRREVLAAATGLGAWALGATLALHPFHLAFFNGLVGGPDAAWEVARDSDLDWGQEDFLIADYVARSAVPVAVRPPGPVPGRVAISANDRAAVPDAATTYDWLEGRDVVDRVGWTWFVYEAAPIPARR